METKTTRRLKIAIIFLWLAVIVVNLVTGLKMGIGAILIAVGFIIYIAVDLFWPR